MKDSARAKVKLPPARQAELQRQDEERRIVRAINAKFEQSHTAGFVLPGHRRRRVAPRRHQNHRDAWASITGATLVISAMVMRPRLRPVDSCISPLQTLESCAPLFTRFGHAHAVGFSLPGAFLSELCAHLDGYARARLTLADFRRRWISCHLTLEEVTLNYFSLYHRRPFGMKIRTSFPTSNLRLKDPPHIFKETRS